MQVRELGMLPVEIYKHMAFKLWSHVTGDCAPDIKALHFYAKSSTSRAAGWTDAQQRAGARNAMNDGPQLRKEHTERFWVWYAYGLAEYPK